MANIPFVIDDGCLIVKLTGYLNNQLSKSDFSKYLDSIDTITQKISKDKIGTIYFDDNFSLEKIGGKRIGEILYTPSTTNRDLFLRLSLLQRSASIYSADDEIDLSIFLVSDNYVSSSFIQNRFAGFISDRNITSCAWWDSNKNFQVSKVDDLLACYRGILFNTHQSYSQLSTYSEQLWPNCYFHNEAKRFNQFGLKEITYLPNLLTHLSYLNDCSQQDYSCGGTAFIQKASVAGVTLSPESPKTKSSQTKMKERDIIINNISVRCEWHTKLHATQGRVHFHEGTGLAKEVIDKTNNRVIIGKFASHLSV